VLLYLAGAGVGRLGIVDFDTVEAANLHRQIIHREQDQGASKALSAQRAVRALNSSVECVAHECRFDERTGMGLVRGYDLVVDASDNPRTRYLINDACVLAGRPLVSGAALGTEGQVTVYNHQGGPCYRCLYPRPLAGARVEGRECFVDLGMWGQGREA
jgi:adenylyltransferase and sulfurtransferase